MHRAASTASAAAGVHLAQHAYGKHFVNLVKVIRPAASAAAAAPHHIHDLTVRVLLSSNARLVTSYTEADNALVVATDTIKNIIYLKAHESTRTGTPEAFAMELGRFFLSEYAHVEVCEVSVWVNKWDRMVVGGKAHTHGFIQNNGERRSAHLSLARSAGRAAAEYVVSRLESRMQDVVVLKTTGSSFKGFHRDQYRTLPDADDRVLSTSVDCRWRAPASLPLSTAMHVDWDGLYAMVKDITITRFAVDSSPSVQGTLWDMAVEIMSKTQASVVDEVEYRLPNRHVFTVDMSKWGVKNEGPTASVYKPLADPSGLITAIVKRNTKARL